MIGFGFIYYQNVFKLKQVYFFRKDPLFWLSTGVIFVNFLHLLFVNAVFIESFRNNQSSGDVFKVLNTIGNIFLLWMYYNDIYMFLQISQAGWYLIGATTLFVFIFIFFVFFYSRVIKSRIQIYERTKIKE